MTAEERRIIRRGLKTGHIAFECPHMQDEPCAVCEGGDMDKMQAILWALVNPPTKKPSNKRSKTR